MQELQFLTKFFIWVIISKVSTFSEKIFLQHFGQLCEWGSEKKPQREEAKKVMVWKFSFSHANMCRSPSLTYFELKLATRLKFLSKSQRNFKKLKKIWGSVKSNDHSINFSRFSKVIVPQNNKWCPYNLVWKY